MSSRSRPLLLLGGAISFGVAALHVAIVLIGPPGYRFFGAPSLADAVEKGSVLRPALLTLGIAVLFAVWGAYALSAARVIRRLPLLRTALVLIGAVYVLRGLLVAPEFLSLIQGTLKHPRALVFSAASLITGLCYVVGVALAWSSLHHGSSHAA
jgi:hypothetical protein